MSALQQVLFSGSGADTGLVAVNSTTFTIGSGFGARAGDLLVLIDAPANNAVTPFAPTGFTTISNNGSISLALVSSYKILTGADLGATVTGMAGTNARKGLMYFRFASSVSTVTSGGAINSTATPMPTTTITSGSGTGSNVIAVGVYRDSSGTLTTTFSPAPSALPYGTKDFDASGGAGSFFFISFNTFTGAPSDVSTSASNTSYTNFRTQVFYLNVS